MKLVLSDGRERIAVKVPGLADVHIGWVFDWMLREQHKLSLKDAYLEMVNEKRYPKVVAWIERLNRFVSRESSKLKPKGLVTMREFQ